MKDRQLPLPSAVEELERKQIAESGFSNWPRDYAAEYRAYQRSCDPPYRPPDCTPSESTDEYLEGERQFPITDRWEREAEACHSYEENEADRKARD